MSIDVADRQSADQSDSAMPGYASVCDALENSLIRFDKLAIVSARVHRVTLLLTIVYLVAPLSGMRDQTTQGGFVEQGENRLVAVIVYPFAMPPVIEDGDDAARADRPDPAGAAGRRAADHARCGGRTPCPDTIIDVPAGH
jgi:hypothetical protein